MNLITKSKKEFKKIINSKIFGYIFITPILFIKKSMWVIELLIAIFAIFIAYPEYKDFIEKSNTPNINWQWEVEFETLESSYKSYIWDKNTYNLFFIWDKNEYIWKGERIKVNDKFIDNFNDRARIEFKLFINDNKIYSLYDLNWKRKTDWNFEVILSKDSNSFEWKFIWNAAESKGIVKWFKIN